jgi:hypothetical protein
VDLEQLAFHRSNPRHQPIELGEKILLVLRRFFDEISGWAVVNTMNGVGQAVVQELHMLLQTQKLLTQFLLLHHR